MARATSTTRMYIEALLLNARLLFFAHQPREVLVVDGLVDGVLLDGLDLLALTIRHVRLADVERIHAWEEEGKREERERDGGLRDISGGNHD